MFGVWCTGSLNPCDFLQPCLNNGTCIKNSSIGSGYTCQCPQGIEGIDCELDRRVCQPTTCSRHGKLLFIIVNLDPFLFFQSGECNATSLSAFECTCVVEYEGDRCQSLVNFCRNVTCVNGGVCRSRYNRGTCVCNDDFYYGQYCELLKTSTNVRINLNRGDGRLSWSLPNRSSLCVGIGWLMIFVLSTFVSYILLMDILKYVFGIDPVEVDRDHLSQRRFKARRKRCSVAIRFTYVPGSDSTS